MDRNETFTAICICGAAGAVGAAMTGHPAAGIFLTGFLFVGVINVLLFTP